MKWNSKMWFFYFSLLDFHFQLSTAISNLPNYYIHPISFWPAPLDLFGNKLSSEVCWNDHLGVKIYMRIDSRLENMCLFSGNIHVNGYYDHWPLLVFLSLFNVNMFSYIFVWSWFVDRSMSTCLSLTWSSLAAYISLTRKELHLKMQEI